MMGYPQIRKIVDISSARERQRTMADEDDSDRAVRSTGARSDPRWRPVESVPTQGHGLSEDELIAAHRNDPPVAYANVTAEDYVATEDDYPASAWLPDGSPSLPSAAVRSFHDKMRAAGLSDQLALEWGDPPQGSTFRR